MRYGNGFTRGLNARGHSVFCFLRCKKKTSLAPCALAGDPLATTVCGRRMSAVVSVTANERHIRNNICFLRSHVGAGRRRGQGGGRPIFAPLFISFLRSGLDVWRVLRGKRTRECTEVHDRVSDEQGAADAETQSKNKKLVGIERFDEERSDEEPCVTSRMRSGARQLPKKSLSPTGHEALAKREEQKSGAAANNICDADTAVLRKIDFETVWKKGKKMVGIERFELSTF